MLTQNQWAARADAAEAAWKKCTWVYVFAFLGPALIIGWFAEKFRDANAVHASVTLLLLVLGGAVIWRWFVAIVRIYRKHDVVCPKCAALLLFRARHVIRTGFCVYCNEHIVQKERLVQHQDSRQH
jgi:hypothetical protein